MTTSAETAVIFSYRPRWENAIHVKRLIKYLCVGDSTVQQKDKAELRAIYKPSSVQNIPQTRMM